MNERYRTAEIAVVENRRVKVIHNDLALVCKDLDCEAICKQL